MAKPKPPAWVFVGDLHCKSTGLWFTDRISRRDKRQSWLMAQWKIASDEIQAMASTHRLTVGLGGDMVDRPGKEARDAALELLQPITRAGVASEVWGVVGTPYHVGADGEEDRQIYQELGAIKNTRHFHRILQGAQHRLWWTHHGVNMGIDPMAALNNTARTIYKKCFDNEWRRPSLVVAHHVHHAPRDYGYYGGIRVAVTPCWQLPDDYHAKRVTWSAPTIGYLVWQPETDDLYWRTFPIPESVLYG